jgi:hypothetical protein
MCSFVYTPGNSRAVNPVTAALFSNFNDKGRFGQTLDSRPSDWSPRFALKSADYARAFNWF